MPLPPFGISHDHEVVRAEAGLTAEHRWDRQRIRAMGDPVPERCEICGVLIIGVDPPLAWMFARTVDGQSEIYFRCKEHKEP